MRFVILFLFCIASTPAPAQTPACSDQRTTEIVKTIFTESIERKAYALSRGQQIAEGIMSRIAINMRSIRTTRIDRSIGKHFCEGVMEVRLSAHSAAIMSTPRARAVLAESPATTGIRVAGTSITHNVQFTSQLTDDKKEQFVEADGFQVLADLVFQLIGAQVVEQLDGGETAKEASRPESTAPEVEAASKSQVDLDASVQQYGRALIVAGRRYKRYPAIAMQKGWQGRVEVHIVIGANGMVASASIKSGSGYEILDNQAIDMIRKAKTMVPIPVDLRGREFSIDVPIVFNLDNPNS